MKQEIEIPWGPIKVVVMDVSFRKRINIRENQEEEYAVIHVLNIKQMDEISEEHKKNKKKRVKFLCLMCFKPEIYRNLVANQIFSFKGFISFGLGSTFFCISDARDALGIPVTSSESISFCPPDDDID